MRRAVIASFLLTVHTPLAGQTLSDRFRQLFTFGNCGQPLCLSIEGDPRHGSHYIPSVTQGEHDMLSFVTGSIATSLGNLPFTSATSGITFSFVGGSPVATSVSGGPIFAERSQTLGHGRFLFGLNVNGLSMDNIRGIPINDLSFRFTHVNVVSGSVLGDPAFERDVIEVQTDLSLNLLVTSVFASYGLLDAVDVGVLVPIVRASLDGSSDALIDAFVNPSPHMFAAGNTNRATSASSGSAVGVGDVAIRAKVNVRQAASWGAALLADVRLPTGDVDNFLGSGNTSVRALGILSGHAGNFAPHLNAGFAYRSGDNQNNSILATLGFDQLLSPRVSLAAELLTGFELGESKLLLPDPAVFEAPDPANPETVTLTDIPDKKDNLIDASFGFKFQLANDFRAVTNILFPLNEGGLRPKFLWTVGLERTF